MLKIMRRSPWLSPALLAVVFMTAASSSLKSQETVRSRIEDFRADLDPTQVEAAQYANLRSLAMQSYLWGLPAFLHYRQTTEIVQARSAMAPQEEPFGGWVLLRKLATADDRNNVMPNVDTLYGASYVLLHRQGPVVLSIPRVKDRYYSVAIHDAYFNTIDTVGTRNTNGEAANVLILPPGYNHPVDGRFTRIIRAPTPAIALFQRIYIRDSSELALVHGIQDRIRLAPLAKWRRTDSAFPKFDAPEYNSATPVRMISDPMRYFEIVSAHTCRNRPPADYAALADTFTRAGIGPCGRLSDDPAFRRAVSEGASDAQALVNARISTPRMRNGWQVPDPNTGKASTDYTGRAVVQLTQVASFSPEEAMYFVGRTDNDGKPFDGRNAYTLTFAGNALPPIDPRAFWSLTLYDANDNLLSANPLNRYVLRPASPGLTFQKDGSLSLYVSAAKPEAAPQGNWLPAPAGPFVVVLRTYMPQKKVQTGEWFPPALVMRK
jgi:hypothetical protein